MLRSHEKTAFISAATSYLLLSEVYLTHAFPVVPVYSYLLAICGGGYQETWTFQRALPGGEAYTALPSLGRLRI
jgi:hypothetical protein